MSGTPASLIFISYSHKDKKWLQMLQTHLKPLMRGGELLVWDDSRIQPGTNWRGEIKDAISAARLALLLVSPDFLASDFISENELLPLLEGAEKKGVIIFWVAVRESSYRKTLIERYQAANDPSKPLATLKAADRDSELVRICERLENALAQKYVPQEGSCLGESDPQQGQSLIPCSTIEGLWLSRFEYTAYRNNGYVAGTQYDIEYLKAASQYTLYGENISCSGTGRNKYLHTLAVSLHKNSLIGTWLNKNTQNVGCFQLNIHSSCAVMLGLHLGNANDNSIQPGKWEWVKINHPAPLSEDKLEEIKTKSLKTQEFLDSHFSRWVVDAVPICLDEIQDSL
jgi:hypothetical protein